MILSLMLRLAYFPKVAYCCFNCFNHFGFFLKGDDLVFCLMYDCKLKILGFWAFSLKKQAI